MLYRSDLPFAPDLPPRRHRPLPAIRRRRRPDARPRRRRGGLEWARRLGDAPWSSYTVASCRFASASLGASAAPCRPSATSSHARPASVTSPQICAQRASSASTSACPLVGAVRPDFERGAACAAASRYAWTSQDRRAASTSRGRARERSPAASQWSAVSLGCAPRSSSSVQLAVERSAPGPVRIRVDRFSDEVVAEGRTPGSTSGSSPRSKTSARPGRGRVPRGPPARPRRRSRPPLRGQLVPRPTGPPPVRAARREESPGSERPSLARAPGRAAPARAGHRLERLRELFHEERHALRAVVERRAERRPGSPPSRRPAAQPSPPVERVHVQLFQPPRAAEIHAEPAQRVSPRDLLAPIGAEQEQRPLLGGLGERRQELERRRVRPLEVVEEHDGRLLRRDRGERASHRFEQGLAVGAARSRPSSGSSGRRCARIRPAGKPVGVPRTYPRSTASIGAYGEARARRRRPAGRRPAGARPPRPAASFRRLPPRRAGAGPRGRRPHRDDRPELVELSLASNHRISPSHSVECRRRRRCANPPAPPARSATCPWPCRASQVDVRRLPSGPGARPKRSGSASRENEGRDSPSCGVHAFAEVDRRRPGVGASLASRVDVLAPGAAGSELEETRSRDRLCGRSAGCRSPESLSSAIAVAGPNVMWPVFTDVELARVAGGRAEREK